ncbi:Dihydroorotate dehydrogenase [Aphelenchoides besseyi]|nr:Dihydroorotate dehydrogenase [Aphelenchoides besseyi]
MLPRLKPAKLAKLLAGAGVIFVGEQMAWGSERFYNEIMMPTIQKVVDGETGHKLAVQMAAYGLIPRFGSNHKTYDALKCEFLGMKMSNPIGIAAGFDKNGEAIKGLESSGFGFVEIGSVTPLPQEGNEKPRVFRLLEDRVSGFLRLSIFIDLISGHNQSLRFQQSRRRSHKQTCATRSRQRWYAVGYYEIGVNYFANHCDYLVINVSSPNTPGLRALQSKSELEKILDTVKRSLDRVVQDPTLRPKVLLKITSDLSSSDRRDIARRNGVDGLIISNTTVERPSTLRSNYKSETGGLSGPPLRDPSTELTNGKVPIIGCGGIESGADAYEKIRAGASIVQLYTSLVYQGWPVIGKIKRELNECLYHDGYTTVKAAIGVDHLKHLNKDVIQEPKSWWKLL